MATATGSFEITMTPAPAEVGGAVNRADFTKTFTGDLVATGSGLMLSGGDPASGSAGYVAIEAVEGSLGGVHGGFAMQQFGTMHAGALVQHYEVVPGSGRGGLAGLTGTLTITIVDGAHEWELVYEL